MFTIVTPPPEELLPAFELLFQQVPEAERPNRLARAMAMVAQEELRAEQILLARTEGGEWCGAMIWQTLPGASGLLWPPQARPGPLQAEIEDRLVQDGLSRLRQGGAKLVQAILRPEEAVWAGTLERNGFQHVTRVEYLRHCLAQQPELETPVRLKYQNNAEINEQLLGHTLERTYEGTLDCPELNGVRTIEEVLAGHRGQGVYRPEWWWLAFRDSQPVGVLLLNEIPGGDVVELAYVGVVPEARRRGIGRELVQLALRTAHQAGALQLTLALDVRNQPARMLYEELGFELTSWREVYLCFL